MKRTVEETIDLRRQMSLDTCQALRALTRGRYGHDFKQIEALEIRISLCNSKQNTVIIRDAHNAIDGELYDTSTRYWRCNSKLCADCVTRQTREHRKKIKTLFAELPRRKGDRLYFLTFTIPNPNLAFTATRAIVNRAWELFRKRRFCVALLRAGVKSEEFTVTTNGFHYHLHNLFVTKGWMSYRYVRMIWTESVEQAFVEANVPFTCDTDDDMLWVKVKPIYDLGGALHEVCKYITKGDSWTKLPPSVLYEIALIKRYNRMFEAFGEFRDARAKSDHDSDSSPHGDIVHKRSLSDAAAASHPTYWRDRISTMTLDSYRDILLDEFHRSVSIRREQIVKHFPYCTLHDLE